MKSSSVAYVRVFQGKDGWYYQPRSANNRTLTTSESYTRKHDAFRGASRAYPKVKIRIDA
jgi:uncharacterized protein YegP (UPF0339 family)